MNSNGAPLLKVHSLSKHYFLGETKVPALIDVDFDLQASESVGLSGPSGSGKSTLLNIIGSLDSPNAGKVEFEGTPLDFGNPGSLELYRRYKIGFIFQSFNLAPVLTAQENVELALLNHELPKSEVKERAQQMLSSVGLYEHRSKFPRHLSGGQQQRVAVARALIKNPRLVLADEPTASLDGANARNLVELMREVSLKFHTAFLVSTHDPRLLQLLPRIVRLEDGRICA